MVKAPQWQLRHLIAVKSSGLNLDSVFLFRHRILWLRKKDGFQEEYSRSKQEGIEYMLGDNRAKALETLERAKQGKGKVGLEEAAVLKLLMHDTHWTAGKLVPKVYGDKTQQQITGADDGTLHIKWEE